MPLSLFAIDFSAFGFQSGLDYYVKGTEVVLINISECENLFLESLLKDVLILELKFNVIQLTDVSIY